MTTESDRSSWLRRACVAMLVLGGLAVALRYAAAQEARRDAAFQAVLGGADTVSASGGETSCCDKHEEQVERLVAVLSEMDEGSGRRLAEVLLDGLQEDGAQGLHERVRETGRRPPDVLTGRMVAGSSRDAATALQRLLAVRDVASVDAVTRLAALGLPAGSQPAEEAMTLETVDENLKGLGYVGRPGSSRAESGVPTEEEPVWALSPPQTRGRKGGTIDPPMTGDASASIDGGGNVSNAELLDAIDDLREEVRQLRDLVHQVRRSVEGSRSGSRTRTAVRTGDR